MALFGLFKRKVEAPSVGAELLRMAERDPAAFVNFIEEMAPNERLMVLVGHSVAKRTLGAVWAVAKRRGGTHSLEEFVHDAEASYLRHKGENEVVSRRVWWSMVGACLVAFDSVQDERTENGGRVWAALLNSLKIANVALASNALWSNDEKSLFQFPDARLAMQIIGKSEVPTRFRDSQALRTFADSNDIDFL